MELKIKNSKSTFIIDDCDIDKLKLHGDNYFINGKGAVFVNSTLYRGTIVYISRIIVGLGKDNGQDVDHIDGNKLNNRKINLRICDFSSNSCNRKKRIDGVTSRFKCVSKSKDSKKYKVAVYKNGKHIYGGVYRDEILAAIKADDLMIEHHGEFARLNFPLYGA